MANVYYAYNTTDLYLSNSDLSSDSTYGTAQGYTCGTYSGSDSSTSYNKSTCTKITILNLILPDSCYYYFYYFNKVKEIIGLDKMDTSNVTNMARMFNDCQALTSLDLSNFNTDNVTDMYNMFNRCSKLTQLDLFTFNTSNVTNMGLMFYYCSNLTTIYSNNFDISKVTNSSNMFSGSSSLIGAVPYNSSKKDALMANYDTGYFTKPKLAYVRTLQDEHDCTIYPQTISGAVGIEEEMFGSAAGTLATEVLKKLAGVDVENKKIVDYQGNELEIKNDAGIIAEDPETIFPAEAVDADTLNGHQDTYFAKKSDLNELINLMRQALN